MRIRLTLDIQRGQRSEPVREYVEPEHAPEETTKGPAFLERAGQYDFEPIHRIGFLRNEENCRSGDVSGDR